MALILIGALVVVLFVGLGLWLSQRAWRSWGPALRRTPLALPMSSRTHDPAAVGAARSGRKSEALRAWHERPLALAKEARLAGQADRSTRARLPAMDAEPMRQVTDGDIEWQLRSGNLLNAIKLYREKTGVGMREAKVAVETMRHRMRAS
jgi:hypothetical protein